MSKYHVIVEGHAEPVIVEDADTAEAAVEKAKPELLSRGVDLDRLAEGTLVSVVPDLRGKLH